MAKLAISRDFLSELGQLSKPAQSKVTQLAETFRQLTPVELRASKGIHLESYNGAKDPRARTIRIDSNHRGVVLDVGDDDLFILTHIGTHDEVDRWMLNNTFKVNEATGALEILNTVEIDAAVAAAEPPAADDVALFAHRRDRDFVNLGVAADVIPILRAITTQEQLYGLIGILPERQADAVVALEGNDSVEVIYREIAGATQPGTVAADNVAAAIETPASKAQFAVLSSEDELQEMLAKPLAQWRTYLHPSQRDAAFRDYSGPARITGGAGTGKTVVAIHRAAFLARQADRSTARPVLFTTFTKNLAQAIGRDVLELAGSDTAGRVDVVNVDALAVRIVRDEESTQPAIASTQDVDRVTQRVVDERGLQFSAQFIINEWEQVVLAQACHSRSDYFAASRAGRGIRLERRQRAEVWKAIEDIKRELAETGKRTFLQLAGDAEGYLAGRTVKPYRHVVVDEAQDLHEAQWRMLRAAVAPDSNDMFLVGDSHQRIYDRRSSLSKVGINIVGRSKKLRINYRTTHEILRFGLNVLGDAEFDDLDQGTDSHDFAGYHSFLHGPEPVVVGAKSTQAQYSALVDQVKSWLEGGVSDDDIAVCARSGPLLEGAAQALKAAGVLTCPLGPDEAVGDGVRLGTMHRLKGLEFRCVAITDCDDDTVPARWDLTPFVDDPVQRNHDLQRERCLLYVAATRARDGLWVGWSGKRSRFISDPDGDS
jgi:superfamily I DNA/RNA helicase